MSKRGKLYIALIVIALLSIVAFEITKPKEVNWFPSYALHHKIPFGSFVFNQQLERLADSLIPVDRPPFEYLNTNSINGTYVFYNGGISFGEEELNSLLEWVDRGNTLVVAAVNFEEQLLDTLNLGTQSANNLDNFNNEFQVQHVNPTLDSNTSYKFDRPTNFYHFNKIDTVNTTILGFIDKYRGAYTPVEDSLVNSIRQSFGHGKIILNTFPQAFTNYFMLNSPNQNYTAGLLSYLDLSQPIYIDTYYKTGKKFYTSPMYLMLNTKSLKWAYYTLLIGVFIYIVFEGKRKQRAIPVIKPLKNQTVDFTRTIANMYYENGEHKDIAHHKIQHFLEFIRNTMHLDTSLIDDSFIKNLAARSNNTIDDTKLLFEHILNANEKSQLDEDELEELNALIEQFKSHN